MKNIWVQFIIMGPILLIKNLKNMAWFLSKTKTPEKINDLEIKPGFKITYPDNWHERQNAPSKEKTKYFNNWASKL